MVVFTGSGGAVGLLTDAGTGVHIRTGEYILDNGRIPDTDIFSFSRGGEPWFAWEWLSDLAFGLLFRWGGLKGVVVFCGLVIALAYWVSVRHMIWRGANGLVALVVLHAGIAASSMHFLARPHVFTLLFLALALWLIDRDRQRPTPAVWLLVPLTVVWTNMHGGFPALIVCLGAVAVGSLLEAIFRVERREIGQRAARRYGWLALACAGATLVNPYGIRLHTHLAHYMSSSWIRNLVTEFQAPRFGATGGIYLEILLFAGAVLAAQVVRRKELTTALLVLGWAHASLMSVRHMSVYFLVLAPFLAEELHGMWRHLAEKQGRKALSADLLTLGGQFTRHLGRTSLALPVLMALVVTSDIGVRWPRDFPRVKYPVAFADKHGETLVNSRLFTMDSWADYLIFRNYPKQRVFIDGRTDFFGPELSRDYLQLLNGREGWEEIVRQHDLRLFLLPSECGLSSVLKLDRSWERVDSGGGVLLFRKREAAQAGLGTKKLELTPAAEVTASDVT